MSSGVFGSSALGKALLSAMGSALPYAGRGVKHTGNLALKLLKPGRRRRSATLGAFKRNLVWPIITVPAIAMTPSPEVAYTLQDAKARGQTNMMTRAKTANRADAQAFNSPTTPPGAWPHMIHGSIARGTGAKLPNTRNLNLWDVLGYQGVSGVLGGIGALGQPIAKLFNPAAETAGYKIRKDLLGMSLFDRIQADEAFSTKFVEGLGGQLGSAVANAVVGLTAGAVSAGGDSLLRNRQRQAVLRDIMRSDEILSRAPPSELNPAYHTMERFAPTLASDPNAVRSFLREAVTTGGGADYASIANLARAEETVNPRPKHGSAALNQVSNVVATHGLHKVAAAKFKQDHGHDVSTIDLADAVYAISKRAHIRKQTNARINSGLADLRNISQR